MGMKDEIKVAENYIDFYTGKYPISQSQFSLRKPEEVRLIMAHYNKTNQKILKTRIQG